MILIIVLFATFVLLVGCLYFYFFQERFIFLNGKKLPKNDPFHFTTKFEEVFLPTTDHEEINAIHLKLTLPKGVVLYFHGASGNLQKWGNRAAYFLSDGYEVFCIDYRNYGKSTGSFSEVKMYDDALLAYSHLKTMFQETEIVVYGFSLGATFASKVASKNKPKALILEAPFYNLKKAVQNRFRFAPTFLLKYSFSSNKDLPLVTSPITIFHGDQDQTTSLAGAKELFNCNKASKNEFVEISSATHHNICSFQQYKQKLKEILER